MITEAIIGFFIDIIMSIIATVINIAGAPLSGTFSIPGPLFDIASIALFAFTAIYPVMAIWFIWRQIKA